MEQSILGGLTAYNTEGAYPWHMPGHKRRFHTIFPELVENPFSIDVTEVAQLDDFHHPEGIIKEAFERAAQIYGSDQSYYLINGSTCGILAAISAVCGQGDTVIVARNCHKSVYHAIFLLRLKPVYVLPEWNEELHMFGGVSPDRIKKALKDHADAKAVVLVSPTYEGVVSDVERIAKITHRQKVPLIVDEAHGAHFEYMANVNETISTIDYKKVPEPAIRIGADIVIESLHKTLPAMTQCAILHRKGNLVNRDCLEEYLSVYQSSSPSYVFMAASEACIERMDHERDGQFIIYKELLAEYRKRWEKLSHIHLAGLEDFKKFGGCSYDAGKLVFSVDRCVIDRDGEEQPFTGVMLGRMLAEEYGQQMEMAGGSYVIAMTSLADSKEAFEALGQALEIIDGQLREMTQTADTNSRETSVYVRLPEQKMSIAQARESQYSEIPLKEAAGRISHIFLYQIPPEIPIVAPGEVISRDILQAIQEALAQGQQIKGLTKKDNGDYKISVVRESRWRSYGKKLFDRDKQKDRG